MWARIVAALLGLWLIVAPVVLGYTGIARSHDRVVGPLVVAFAVIAMSAVTRPLRRVNSMIAAWLLVAPWLLSFALPARINGSIVAVLLLSVSLVRGNVGDDLGGGWRAIWQSDERRS